MTKREVMDYSPPLADRVARSTATHTVEEAAAEAALDEQVGIWRAMSVVLDSGEHCPHHFRGRKP